MDSVAPATTYAVDPHWTSTTYAEGPILDQHLSSRGSTLLLKMNQTLQKLGWNWVQHAVPPSHILLLLPPPPGPAWLGFLFLAQQQQLAVN